jgi:hypothetical protein
MTQSGHAEVKTSEREAGFDAARVLLDEVAEAAIVIEPESCSPSADMSATTSSVLVAMRNGAMPVGLPFSTLGAPIAQCLLQAFELLVCGMEPAQI